MILGISVDVLGLEQFLVVHGKKVNGYDLLVCKVGAIVIAETLTLITKAFFEFFTYIVIDFY